MTAAAADEQKLDGKQGAGGFRVVIDRVFIGLEQMPKAHAHLASNQTVGKVVVHVSRPN